MTLSNLLLGKLPQYTRKARHLDQLRRHGTPKKIANLLRAEWALRTGKTSLTSMPYIYIIDPCNVCNLRCPLCPTWPERMNLHAYPAELHTLRKPVIYLTCIRGYSPHVPNCSYHNP